jgi:hypothetical protein
MIFVLRSEFLVFYELVETDCVFFVSTDLFFYFLTQMKPVHCKKGEYNHTSRKRPGGKGEGGEGREKKRKKEKEKRKSRKLSELETQHGFLIFSVLPQVQQKLYYTAKENRRSFVQQGFVTSCGTQ